MKKQFKFILPAALALSLTMAPMAYADEFVAGPGKLYDDATMAKLEDNVLEYDEIGLLVDAYNSTMKTLRETYSDNRDSYKDVAKLRDQVLGSSGYLLDMANDLSNSASALKDILGYKIPMGNGTYLEASAASYASALYASELLAIQGEQVALQADQITSASPTDEMLRIQLLDTNRAALTAGAQSAMIGYEQILIQKDSLQNTIELLQAVYESTQLQANSGLATQNDVLNAKQNLETAQAGMLTIDANSQKVRQTLCTLLGWEYNAAPEIRKVPEADLTRIEKLDLEADKAKAVDNNFTLNYNLLSYENLTDGSVQQDNMKRTIEYQKEQIASSMVNLYNDILQKKNEYDTAVKAYELEKTKMDAADRKMQVGTIGKLEYLQQQNALITKEVAMKNANLALFQALETYDWAVAGSLNVS